MEELSNKRTRLRHELQRAYDAWLVAAECQASHHVPNHVDISGSPDGAKARWFEYLAAKERLILDYAEQPLAA